MSTDAATLGRHTFCCKDACKNFAGVQFSLIYKQNLGQEKVAYVVQCF